MKQEKKAWIKAYSVLNCHWESGRNNLFKNNKIKHQQLVCSKTRFIYLTETLTKRNEKLYFRISNSERLFVKILYDVPRNYDAFGRAIAVLRRRPIWFGDVPGVTIDPIIIPLRGSGISVAETSSSRLIHQLIAGQTNSANRLSNTKQYAESYHLRQMNFAITFRSDCVAQHVRFEAKLALAFR